MEVQRYFSKIKKENNLVLIDDDIYHITKVMRMKDNDKIEVVYENELYICNVIINNLPNVLVIEKIEEKESNEVKITLVVPLLKEQKFDLILQKATELGVYEIIPVNMERCLVKSSDRDNKKIERWSKICKEASEQSKRLTIPKISNIKTLKDLNQLEGLKIVCSTSEKSNNIKKILTTNKNYDKIIIVVGPEGGISLKEEEYLVKTGFIKVSLGPRIMRVETVPLFIMSIINYENMEW